MSELSILDLERETVELLPRREALTAKKRRSTATAVNFAAVFISQDAEADASGYHSEATAVNVALVGIEQDADADAS